MIGGREKVGGIPHRISAFNAVSEVGRAQVTPNAGGRRAWVIERSSIVNLQGNLLRLNQG